MKKSLLVGLAISTVILGASTPSDARGRGGHGFSGGHHFHGHDGFHGHHFHGRGPVFVGGAPSFLWGPPWWYYPPPYVAPVVAAPPPVYVQPPLPAAYWYYCRSYGAYYPNVQICPEAWVTVPAAR